MLAEHRQLLNEKLGNQKDEHDVKHGYDEQKFEEWQETCIKAITNNSDIVIKLNNKILKRLIGKIVDWDPGQGYFYIQTRDGERVKILISEIIELLSN